jgi:primosomal protein N' (replication factor Y) (superfamily II helicase)
MKPSKYFVLVSPLSYGGLKDFAFTYQTEHELPVGQAVYVPLRQTNSLGIVIDSTSQPNFKTKAVTSTYELSLPLSSVQLAVWMHNYYQSSAKAIWQTILPSGITKKRHPAKPPSDKFKLPQTNHKLSLEQTTALENIKRAAPKPVLIHGITGSGKTELYLNLTTEILAQGKSVIILVPEITLAPQLVALFSAFYGDIIIATNSGMSEADRHRAWQEALLSEHPRVIIGPRSSLFLPLSNLGLIIIDECHETSYKQDQAPRYQADLVAGQLSRLTGAQLILGSATPSLNQYYLAKRGRLELVSLTSRPNLQPLPRTTIVDLRDKSTLTSSRLISKPLLDALTQTLREGRQSLLFINRRGSATSQICSDCGNVSLCPNCQLPLTFHADKLSMICHYCNFHRPPGAICQNCSSMNLRYLGGGTKKIESEINNLLPTARLARLDRDSATPNHIDSVYRGLHDRSIDVLIGTQMVAKGLNIPNLDVVGIVSADTMLHLPDFSASERTFSLLTQVSGRAGRGERPGQVIIQTYSPSHPAIKAAAKHDYTSFATTELSQRQLLSYPPFIYLLKLSCKSSTSVLSQSKAMKLAEELKKQAHLSVLGPAPAFIERTESSFCWHLIVKAKKRSSLVDIVQKLPDSSWTADLDPINLL